MVVQQQEESVTGASAYLAEADHGKFDRPPAPREAPHRMLVQAASSATLVCTVRPHRCLVRRSSQRAAHDRDALTAM